MRNGKFYDDLKELNQSLYHGVKNFKEFKAVDNYSDNSGILIGIYKKDNEYFFTIKGTDWYRLDTDWQSNRAMCEGKIPKQYYSAEKFYKAIKDTYPNIIFTGYSLGGSIAQMLGSTFGNETICFEPYGAKNLKHGNYSTNIINFGNLHDWVFMVNFKNQIGENYIMPVNANPHSTPNWIWHQANLCGTPSQATKYNNETLLPCKQINTEKITNQLKSTKNNINQSIYKAKTLITSLKNNTNNNLHKVNK